MRRHGMHGRLLGTHIQRGDEGDIPGPGNGDGERHKLGGRRAAFAAKAEDERAASGIV